MNKKIKFPEELNCHSKHTFSETKDCWSHSSYNHSDVYLLKKNEDYIKTNKFVKRNLCKSVPLLFSVILERGT